MHNGPLSPPWGGELGFGTPIYIGAIQQFKEVMRAINVSPRSIYHGALWPSESKIYYADGNPDWYIVTVPQSAAPADIEGCQIFTVTCLMRKFESIQGQQYPSRNWSSSCLHLNFAWSRHTFSECDMEQALLQYLQIKRTLLIGMNGGKERHHNGSYSWIICSPGRKKLVLNAGLVDGWHRCQSSLVCSKAAAITSLTLYVDKLTTYHQMEICCNFWLLKIALVRSAMYRHWGISSQSVGFQTMLIFCTQWAPITTCWKSTFCLPTSTVAHQDKTTNFEDLPFSAQLNVLCDTMATAQMQHRLPKPMNKLFQYLCCQEISMWWKLHTTHIRW